MSYDGDEYETPTILYGGGAYDQEMAVVLDGSAVARDECMVVARDEQVVVRGVLVVAEGGRVVIPPLDMMKEEQTRLRLDTNSAQEVYAVEMVIPVPSAPHLPAVSPVPLGHFPMAPVRLSTVLPTVEYQTIQLDFPQFADYWWVDRA